MAISHSIHGGKPLLGLITFREHDGICEEPLKSQNS